MKGWNDVTIGDSCEVIAGQSPAGEYYNQENIGLPFYQGKKEFGEKFISAPQIWTRKTTKEAECGDILMSVRAPVGPINFAVEKICIGRGLAAIRAGAKIDRYFLFYCLLSKQNEINGNEGAVFASINKKQIESIKFWCPSLIEQKRIVSIVDEAFEAIDIAIDNTKQNIANARELFDSYLNAIFTQKGEGWKEKKLDEIGGKVSTGPFGSLLHKSDYISGGIPIVNPANIEENKIIPNFNKTISQDVAKRMHSYILKEKDVVVGRRGEIGRCAVVGEEEAGWLCGSGSFFINPFENVNSIFLAHLIRSVPYRSKLEELASGATMLNLSNQSLSDLVIAMPSLDEQNQITNKLDDLRTETQCLEAIYQQKLTVLNELKQSILYKAFTGELTADKADLMTNIEPEAIAV
jgi:type I restriction enzyme, S subunit